MLSLRASVCSPQHGASVPQVQLTDTEPSPEAFIAELQLEKSLAAPLPLLINRIDVTKTEDCACSSWQTSLGLHNSAALICPVCFTCEIKLLSVKSAQEGYPAWC